MKKAMSELTIILTLVAAIFLVFVLISIFFNDTLTQSKSFEASYFAIHADAALQNFIQGFEKTALLFGLMNTAKDLSMHGGISDPESISGENPEMSSANDILFLAPIRCDDAGCKIRKRMPFVFYEDMNAKIGTGEVQYLIASTQEGTDKNFEENFRDVAAGKYQFNVLVQVFMLKPGTVTFKICQADRCTSPEQITKSEARIVQVGAGVVVNNEKELILSVVGSDENVAVLRQVVVSIYDKDVVAEPNKRLTKYMNAYREKFASQQSGIKLDLLDAAFIPAQKGISGTLEPKQGFLRGIVWAPNKVEAKYPDANVLSTGIAEEELKVRYWRTYRIADYFADIVDLNGIVMPRLLRGSDTKLSNDYYRETYSDCGSDPGCPPDATKPYSKSEFLDALNSGLSDLANELNTMCGNTGLFWEIRIPETVSADMGFTNTLHMKEDKSTSTCSLPCNCRSEGDPPTEVCDSCPATYYSCTREYARRYTSDGKNLDVLVEITDEKYTLFDSASGEWVHPTFRFFVEFYPVDDNYCDGYACNSIETGRTGATLPTPAKPPRPPADLQGDNEGLFSCAHRRADCVSAGGETVYDGEDAFCRFSSGSCPAGWMQYKQYSTTVSRHCDGWCSFDEWDCDTSGHAWANTAVESCTYLTEPYGTTRACEFNTCTATTTYIGCY